MFDLLIDQPLDDAQLRAGIAAGWDCAPKDVVLAADFGLDAAKLFDSAPVVAAATPLAPGGLALRVQLFARACSGDYDIPELVDRAGRFAAAAQCSVIVDSGGIGDEIVWIDAAGGKVRRCVDLDALDEEPPGPVTVREESSLFVTVAARLDIPAPDLRKSVGQALECDPHEICLEDCGGLVWPGFPHGYWLQSFGTRPWFPDAEDAGRFVRGIETLLQEPDQEFAVLHPALGEMEGVPETDGLWMFLAQSGRRLRGA